VLLIINGTKVLHTVGWIAPSGGEMCLDVRENCRLTNANDDERHDLARKRLCLSHNMRTYNRIRVPMPSRSSGSVIPFSRCCQATEQFKPLHSKLYNVIFTTGKNGSYPREDHIWGYSLDFICDLEVKRPISATGIRNAASCSSC
jgi:hypothetical protein